MAMVMFENRPLAVRHGDKSKMHASLKCMRDDRLFIESNAVLVRYGEEL